MIPIAAQKTIQAAIKAAAMRRSNFILMVLGYA
jgi:hypothetical protein